MATSHNAITLTTANTAYKIVAANGGNGNDITIQNNNTTASVLIGDSLITPAVYGFKVVPGAAISFELDGKDAIWAVSATAGATINVMSINLEGTRIV